MSYIENPKTRDSGIVCCIPQTGECPNGCEDCFFQSGRSFLEPLADNLPNMPSAEEAGGRIVRVNDGNDSNVNREAVLGMTSCYERRFFNTAIPKLDFPGPVVLTVNPGKMTDVDYHQLDTIPANLMFARVRANTWNLDLVDAAIAHYTGLHKVPVVLTFMAYFKEDAPYLMHHEMNYAWRKRTLNSYWAIKTVMWSKIMRIYEHNPLVYSCGREGIASGCVRCGNCLREYFVTTERMRACEES